MAETHRRMTLCRISQFCLLSLLVTMATAGPIKEDRNKILTCSRHCRVPARDRKFQYVPDQVYDYSYKVEVSSHMLPTPHRSSRLVIEAVANVHVLSACDMILKLREVRIMEKDPEGELRKTDNSKYFRQELEKEPLRFAFLDGHISDVCPTEAETTWALNIKRGFLSTFQNNMEDLKTQQTVEEVDVLGSCRTLYHTTGTNWFSNTIKKSRDLANCSSSSNSSRNSNQLSAFALSHKSDSKSTLLDSFLSGQQDCQQTIDWNGVISSIYCLEQRHFRPLAGETTGSVTKVSQTVTFLQKRERGKFFPPVYKRSSLEYDPVATTPTPENDALRRVREVLRQVCLLSEMVPETADLFYELVTNLRSLSDASLRVLYEKVSGTSLCADHLRLKKVFLDGLAMAGTEPGLRLLVKELTRRSQEPISAHFLLSTLPFLPSITSPILQTVRTLLDYAPTSEPALLPVSSMVHRYCQQYEGDCHTHTAVQRLLPYFRRAVGAQCLANGPQAPKIVLGLRAIGNAGQAHRVIEILHACLRRKNNPLDVRISAVEAFRRMPCSVSRERVQQMFEDTLEDPELRIASYLSMMHCASTSHFLQLQRTLTTESDTQVLSFIFTHLTKWRDRGAEFSDDAKHVLEHVDFASKELERLQLSRHFSGSALSDRLMVVSNLIWPSSNPHPSSSSSSSTPWLPRSLNANLTLTLLGQALDLAEVGVRGEGLEVLFGEVFLSTVGWKKPSMGPKKLQEQINRVKASLYARILGDELFHFQLGGTGNFMEQLSSGKAFNLKALLSKIVAEGKISYSQNLVLTDQKRSVPTSSGLPLTVSLNGSMAAQLKVLGSVDFGQAFDKPRSLHLNGALKPSGVLRVSASMMVDAMVTRTALRMTGTLHTNTIVKGRVHLDRGKMVNVELDLPRDNMTILDARTEMTFIVGNEEQALALTPGEEHELRACTGQQGVRLTGLDLCGKVQMPKSITSGSVYGDIVSNPSSVSVVLHKRDTLSQYKLFAQHLMTKHSLTTQLTISTPKSSVDRTLDLCVDVNLKQRQMELRMMTPWKKLALIGSLTSTPKKKEAQLTLALDETVTHGVTAAVTVRKDKLGVTYIPVVELRHFDTGPMTLSGVVSVGKFQRKVTAEVTLKGVLDFVPSLKGSLTNSRKEVSLRGTLSLSPGSSCSIAAGTFITVSGKQAGKMELTPFFFINTNAQQLISLSGKGDYRQARSIRADVKVATVWTRPVSFKCTLARSPTRNQIHYRFDTEYKSSSALVSIDARADVKKMQMLLTRLSVSHDIPDLLPRDTVSMVTKLGKRSKAKYWNSFLQSSFQSRAYPQHNFDVKLHTEFEPTNSRVNMHYGYGADPLANNQYVTLTSKMRHDVKSLGNMDLAVRATAEIPSEKVKMELKASHSHSGRGLETKVIINSGKGQQTKAHLILINKSNGYLLIVGRATLVLPQSQDKLFSSSRKRKSRKIPADFQMQIKVTEKDESYEITTGAHSGKRKKDFSAVLSIKKPVSHRRLQMYCKGNPYSKTYQEFEAELSHAMHPLLADIVEAVLTRDLSELDLVKPFRLLTSVHGAAILQNDTESAKDLNGYANPDLDFNTPAYSTVEVDSLYTELLNAESIQEDDERSTKMNIKGGLDIKSTFIDLMSNSWNFAHTYTGSWHKTDITLADNGDNYAYEMSIRDNVAKWQEHSGGKIIISTPEKKLAAEFTHEYDGCTIRTTCLTSWSKHRQILINLSGRVGKSNQTQALFGDILLKSPWKPLKDFRASLAHDTGRGLLRSKSTFRLNGVIRASHQVTFVQTSIFTDAGVMMVTPWTKKVTGSVIVQHGFYPMTCTAEVSWNPRHRASVTGTADLQTWDEVQISLNVKTTVKTVKRISAEVVNKVDGENLVSEIKAQYGTSNTFSVKNVLRRHDWRRLRFRILSPIAQFRVLETGYEFDGTLRNLSANADFRIYPLVKKIDGSLVWVYDTNLSGKLHVDIPLKEFPYVQISTTSEIKNSYRYSSVILKYHSSQVYALNSKYTLHSLQDIVVSIETPHRSFDSTAIQFHQEETGFSKDFSVKILLPREQRIVVVGHIDMDRKVHGTFSLSSPFPGFESCGAAFVYSFDESGLLLGGNLTTEKRSVTSRVALYGNNTDLVSVPASAEGSSVIQTIAHLRSLQRAELDFQASSLNQVSLQRSEDFKLLMLYSQPEHSSRNKFQLDLRLTNETRLSSNITQSGSEAMFAVLAIHGNDYFVSSNASISNLELQSWPKHTAFSNKTPQLGGGDNVQKRTTLTNRPASNIFHTADGIIFNVEMKAPFLHYEQIGFQTNFERSFQDAGKVGFQENKNEDRFVSQPAHLMRIVGWTGHSQTSRHGVYFNISHSTGLSLHETNVDVRTALKDANNVSYHFHSRGLPANLSGDMQLKVNDKQFFRTQVKHVHNEHILHSAVSCQNNNINNVTVAFFYERNKLIVDASTFYNGTFDFNGSYTNHFDREDTRTVYVTVGANSFQTGAFKSSTNISFSEGELSSSLFVMSNSTARNNHVNATFLVNKPGHVYFSGQVVRQSNVKDTPPETSEIKLGYKGDPENLTALIFLTHSNTDLVDMRAKVNYESLFAMDTEVVLRSPFPYANDLNLAVKSSSSDGSDQHALMTVGWAPYRQISVDLRHKHSPSVLGLTRQTDIVIITPFQQFQNGLISIRRSKILTKIDQSVLAKVNGQDVLNVGISSSDPSALGVRQPLLSLFQRSGMAIVQEKPSHRMNIFIQWNLTNPNCKLGILTEYKTSDKADETQVKIFTMNVTHSWKKVNVTCLFRKAPGEVSSEGELTWNENPSGNEKVYYTYSLSNKTTLSELSYEGHCRLRIPQRTIAANGSWALTNLVQPEHGIDERHRSYSAHGVFYWDADRDVQKQLAVTTLLAAGDTRSADVAVSIPILSQTIRLKSDLALEVRDVIWNSTTSLNLSPDPSKTLTFSTAMVMTPGPTEGINYTMTTFLTQPSSFVDVGMVSAAFGSSSELSTSLNGWFLMTEKTMQKVLLTGTYDRLKKNLEVMMVTPTRNASVTTELSSGKSYKLEAVGRTTDAEDFENNKELGLYVSLDPFHRSFLVKVNRDAGDSPSNYMAVEAWYVNDSAIRAEVYRPHVTGSMTDSALSIWLNSSTLLHVDLSWRPLLTQELQVLAQETATRLNEYHTQLTHTWTQASQSIQNQIIQKWEAMRSQSVEDLQPSIDLMLRELALLHQLKNNVLRDLDDAFRINSDVKEVLVQLLDEARKAVRHGMVYTRSSEAYQRAAELVSRSLTKVRRSEIAYLYTDFVDRLPLTLAMAKRQSRERLQEVVHYINMYSLLVKKHMAELGNTLYSLRDLDIDDISEMFEGELLWQNLQNVGATAEVWLAPLSNTTYFLTANEFYQQGSWLYGYLNLDYHLDPHLEKFAESLKNIIMAEMRFRSRHIRFLQRSRFTVWEPQRGKIQAEVCLPFPVRSLWTLPHLPNEWTPARERAG